MDTFRGLRKTGEANIIEHDNSLSRALFALSSAVYTAAQYAAAAGAATYAGVVVVERFQLLPIRTWTWAGLPVRGLRWMAPLGTSIVAAFIGTRVGLYAGIDVLNARATLDRQAASHAAQQPVGRSA